MWQEILAVDSKLSHLRMAEAGNDGNDLRALYLKRRLQLLQGAMSMSRHVSGGTRSSYLSM